MLWLHRWVGVTLALFVLVAALSGGLLLWSDEYHRWRHPELAVPEPPAAVRAPLLHRVLAAAPGPVGTVAMPREGLPAFHLYLRDGSQAFHHARSGALIDHWEAGETLPSFLFEAHVRLLSGAPGHTIVGVLGLALAALLLTGLWAWWPRRRRLKLRRWVPRRATNLSLMKAHAAQGVMTLALAVYLALSGAAIVFHQPAGAVLNALLGSAEVTRPTVSSAPGATVPVDWERLLDAAERAFPEARLRFATLPAEAGRPTYLRLKQPSELHPNGRTALAVHPQSGEILQRIDATTIGAGPAVFNALYPLHAGKTGWPGHRALLLLVAGSLAYVAASGTYVFLRRRAVRSSARSEMTSTPPSTRAPPASRRQPGRSPQSRTP